MLGGNSGLFFIKKKDGTLQDSSGFFEHLFALQDPYWGEALPPEIKKWVHMDLEEIDKSYVYTNLPNTWKIQVLNHIIHDYRFTKDKTIFESEIILLKKHEAKVTRHSIYDEAYQRALRSKTDAIEYLKELISDNKRSIIHGKLRSSQVSDLDLEILKEEEQYLKEILDWIETSTEFDEENEITATIIQQEAEEKNNHIEFDLPISIGDKLKFAIASELGVIAHLQQYLIGRGIKPIDKNVYPLLSLITGISFSSIKRMFPFHKDKTKQDYERNPWKKDEIDNYIKKFNFYISKGEIYNDTHK